MKLTINEFLKENLFKKFILHMFFGAFVVFVTLLVYTYLSSIKSEQEKISHLLNSNKEDIFNALILEEYDALEKNLNIIMRNYSFDKIQIRYKNITVRSNPELSVFDEFLSNLYGTTLTKTVSNDFSTISFQIDFSFYTKVFTEGILPAVKVFFILILFLGLAQWVFFRRHKQIIELSVVGPLSQFVKAVENENYDLDIEKFEQIHEVSVLANSLNKFKDIRYAQLHSEIASQFAHDVKTPLNAIKRIIEQDPYFRSQKMDYLKISLDRIESVSRDLLLMRKNNKQKEVADFSPSSLVYKIYQEFRIANDIKYDFLTFRKGHGFAFSSYVEIETLERILSNIIVNSWEAIRNRANPKLTVSISVKEKNVELVFLDNGEGISEENIGDVFTKGFTTKKSGNGLGLSSAKKYLISVGGDILVDSEPDIFTKISIVLPVISIVKEKSEKIEKRVILIDDDKYNHIPLKSHFSNSGIDFSSYSSITEFFSDTQMINEQSVILLDSHLGSGLRGESYASAIRSMGFKEVYLYTASNVEDLNCSETAFLKGVIEKSDIGKIDEAIKNAWHGNELLS